MVLELANAVPQRIFSEENHLFQRLFRDASYKTLGVGGQIWGSRRQLHRSDSHIRQHAQKLVCVERIAIVTQRSKFRGLHRNISHGLLLNLEKGWRDSFVSRQQACVTDHNLQRAQKVQQILLLLVIEIVEVLDHLVSLAPLARVRLDCLH